MVSGGCTSHSYHMVLGNNMAHEHECGFRQQHRMWTSTWPLVVPLAPGCSRTLDIHMSLYVSFRLLHSTLFALLSINKFLCAKGFSHTCHCCLVFSSASLSTGHPVLHFSIFFTYSSLVSCSGIECHIVCVCVYFYFLPKQLYTPIFIIMSH